MKIVTAAEMREIDRITTQRYGVPSLNLMENAGSAVAEFVLEQYPEAQRIGVICGKGNNGGDGLVAARKLHEAGKAVSVLLLADPAEVKGDAAQMLKLLPLDPVLARNEDELESDAAQRVFKADLLVDAILGTGFKPPMTGLYAAAIREMNRVSAAVVAVDIESGEPADDPDFYADYNEHVFASGVVTFTAPKPHHVFGVHLSPVVVAEIGSPPEVIQSLTRHEVITPDDILRATGPRWTSEHKGDFGHVLVVGGSRGKVGAAAMAGVAALRAGAGLCTVAAPRSIQDVVSSFAPELMTEDLSETEAGTVSLRAFDLGRMDSIVRGKTVLAVGPGISRHPESAEFVRTLVHRREGPIVLDADGLNAFEGQDERLDGTGVPLILTPHPGEMARLTGDSAITVDRGKPGNEIRAMRETIAAQFATRHQCFVVLKGHHTVVAYPDGTVWINTTGNAGMATGGTGDILTGIVAALVAREIKAGWTTPERPYENIGRAVCAAVFLHGMAGDFASLARGEHPMIATDLLEGLSPAFLRALRLVRPTFTSIRNGHKLRLDC